MIRALLFDFDGLILDTETIEFQGWQAVYRAHGAELPAALWVQAVGRGFTAEFEPYSYLEQQTGRALDRDAIHAQVYDHIHVQPLLPGVENYLETARRLGIKTAVASSSSYRWVGGHLTRLGLLHAFDAIRTADNVTHTKPDPELFLSALAALDVAPHEAIVLEDSPNGILAAKRAGIFAVAVPNAVTAQLPLDHADLVISSLADLPLESLLEHVRTRRAQA